MRRGASSFCWVLLALVVAGCDAQKDLVVLAMLIAPFSYLGALVLLIGLRWAWRWRRSDSLARPAVLAIPGVILFGAAWLPLMMDSVKHDWGVLILGAMVLAPIMGPALCVPVLVVWRIWFWFSARESFEGAAILATLCFFAPGLSVLFGLIPITEALLRQLSLLCLYLAAGFTPVCGVLMGEALLTRASAQKPG